MKKERNFCIKQLKKTKRDSYSYLDVKPIIDNKLFRGVFRTLPHLWQKCFFVFVFNKIYLYTIQNIYIQ